MTHSAQIRVRPFLALLTAVFATACQDSLRPVEPANSPAAVANDVSQNAPTWTIVATQNPSTSADALNGVLALSTNDVWAVGYKGSSTGTETLVERMAGGAWTVSPSPNPGVPNQCGNGNILNDVGGSSSTNVWAVGFYYSCSLLKPLAMRWNGTQWTAFSTPIPGRTGNNILNAVAVTSSTDAWAVGYYEASNGAPTPLILRFNGTSWTKLTGATVPGATSNVLNSVAALGPSDVWAAGTYYDPPTGLTETMIQHYNGSTWSIVPSPNPGNYLANVINQLVALSPTDVWAIGYYDDNITGRVTLTEHWDGSAWSIVPSPNGSNTYFSANELNGAVALSPTDIWAVGHWRSDATIQQKQTLTLHWDGSAWTISPSPTRGKASNLNSVATTGGVVWAVGETSRYGDDPYTGAFIIPQTLAMKR